MDQNKVLKFKSEHITQTLLIGLVMFFILGIPSYLVAGNLGVLISIFSILFIYLSQSFLPLQQIMRMHRAIPINTYQDQHLVHMVYNLVKKANLPQMPQLYFIPTSKLNAFAIANHHQTAIAITQGIRHQLNDEELEGVLAHEISHLKNNDTKFIRLADITTQLTSSMSQLGLFLAILSIPFILVGVSFISFTALLVLWITPLINTLLQLALSRTREFAADLDAVSLTQKPHALASALNKLEQYSQSPWQRMFGISNKKENTQTILSTHPPTQERIERLLSLRTQQEHFHFHERRPSQGHHRASRLHQKSPHSIKRIVIYF